MWYWNVCASWCNCSTYLNSSISCSVSEDRKINDHHFKTRNSTVKHLWKKEWNKKERRSRVNSDLMPILILICGQGQRPGSTPKANEAWEVLVSPNLWGVIRLWGFDLGKWEATVLTASTISYQSYLQTSIDYLQGLGPKISCSHCTERSCLSLAVEIYCN